MYGKADGNGYLFATLYRAITLVRAPAAKQALKISQNLFIASAIASEVPVSKGMTGESVHSLSSICKTGEYPDLRHIPAFHNPIRKQGVL